LNAFDKLSRAARDGAQNCTRAGSEDLHAALSFDAERNGD
jgi:hypothetical protein